MLTLRTCSAEGRLLAAVLTAAHVGACAAVGPNFKPPAPPVSTAYAGPREAAPVAQHVRIGERVADDWWSAFHSAELDGIMRQALRDNPSLQAADATLAQYRAELASLQGQRTPQADLTAGAERERLNLSALGFNSGAFPGFAINNNPEFPLYSIGASVSYAVDIWGGLRRQLEGSAARAEAQGRRADAAYLTLTGDVASQAAMIAALRAEIATVQAILQDDQHNIALVRSAAAAGGVAQEASVNAEAQTAADATLLPPLEQQLSLARHALARLVGRAPAEWSAPDFDIATLALPQDIPVSLPSELVRARPDILQAEADLHAATADIGVQTARLYPSLNLTASLTQSNLTPDKLFSWPSTAYTLAGGLTAPLFHGGQVRAQGRAAEAVARAAEASYRATVIKAFTEVADLMQALVHDEGAMSAAERAQASALASLRYARLAYQEGGTGLLPVVDAQRQVNTARLALTRVQAQRYLDTIQLFVATGHGWSRPASMAQSLSRSD